MNILIASHLYPSVFSRIAGSFVHNQVRFLDALGDIQVVSPTPWFLPLPGFGRWSRYNRIPSSEVMDGIQVRRPRYLTYPRRLFFAGVWRSYLKALQRSAAGVPDLIHAHCAYPDGRAAVEWGRRLGKPVVITVHGHDIKVLPRLKKEWRRLIAEALQQAQAVIAVSGELGEMVRDLGVDADKVRLIPNGVDCRAFAPDFKRPAGQGGWRLLYVGRFDPAKGIGVLLEAKSFHG